MLEKSMFFIRYLLGGLGLYIGLSNLNSNVDYAIAMTSLLAVGVVGVLSFASHVLFHKQDAKKIGFSTKNVDFQFEVGFANLAFGITAIVSFFANWGVQANIALIFAYALYLFQAGIFHTVKSLSGKKTDMANRIRGVITIVYSGLMFYLLFEVFK